MTRPAFQSQLLQKNKGAWLCGFAVSTMTFWKTVIYMMQYFDFCAGGHLVQHHTWQQYLGLFMIPNGIWVVLPFYFMLIYGRRLKSGLDSTDITANKNKSD